MDSGIFPAKPLVTAVDSRVGEQDPTGEPVVQGRRAKALRRDTAHYSRCATVGRSLNSFEPIFSSPVRRVEVRVT